MYSAYEIISKKRDKKTLKPEEIKWFIEGLLKGEIGDYQMSALLMAIYLNGFNVQETAALTDAMLYSGKTVQFVGQEFVDKHSTGGVGDKASFILAPLASACGVKVPMIAGRGLGHTGGTVDKVESIPNFKTNLGLKRFKELAEETGIVLIGQTKEIAPADKIIYGLRDVTATIESIPLITASIMSKKLAEGANGIVMDIKIGNGAFMSNKAQAKKLAKSIRDTGKRFNRNMMTIITDMNQPLGNAVGNSLEIIESIETLKGNGPKDLTDISLHLAGGMIHLAGLAKSHAQGIRMAKAALKDGSALAEFEKMIVQQNGDASVINDYSILPTAKHAHVVAATRAGYLKSMDTRAIGQHVVKLGGGRMKAGAPIDFGVGMSFHKKIGDKVKAGEPILTLHHNGDQTEIVHEIADALIQRDIQFSKTKPTKLPELIYDTQISWS